MFVFRGLWHVLRSARFPAFPEAHGRDATHMPRHIDAAAVFHCEKRGLARPAASHDIVKNFVAGCSSQSGDGLWLSPHRVDNWVGTRASIARCLQNRLVDNRETGYILYIHTGIDTLLAFALRS